MSETAPRFDARLKEGVAYFEEMLKVMPDDRTTLEFLAVVYPQLGETEKAEKVLAALTRVLMVEGDLESASALLPRLEKCSLPEAKALALKVRVASAPRPDLSPETPAPAGGGAFASVVEKESALAEEIGEPALAELLRSLPDPGHPVFVSALASLAKDRPEACEKAIAGLADKYGLAPVPLEAFEPDRAMASQLPDEMVVGRGVIPFARLGDLALVVTLSPNDADLRRQVGEAMGMKVRFFLAEPGDVESAIEKLRPSKEGN